MSWHDSYQAHRNINGSISRVIRSREKLAKLAPEGGRSLPFKIWHWHLQDKHFGENEGREEELIFWAAFGGDSERFLFFSFPAANLEGRNSQPIKASFLRPLEQNWKGHRCSRPKELCLSIFEKVTSKTGNTRKIQRCYKGREGRAGEKRGNFLKIALNL